MIAVWGMTTVRATTVVAVGVIGVIVDVDTCEWCGVGEREGTLTARSDGIGGRVMSGSHSFVHVARADDTVRVRAVISVRTASIMTTPSSSSCSVELV